MSGFDLSTISNVYVGSTKHSSIYLGSTLIWQSVPLKRLPAGYTELEYISSSNGGNQYIDLGIKLYDTLNKDYDIAIKFIISSTNSESQATIFNCQDPNNNPWPGTYIRKNNSNGVTGRYIGGSAKDNTLGQLGSVIELSVKTPPNKNVTNLNNNNSTHQYGAGLFSSFSTTSNTPQRYCNGTIYYFKLFVEGVLVRDMVPCKDPNNVVGMYDLANGVFYSSPNGNAFIAGPETCLYDAEIEYLESSGSQYIDTGIIPTSDTGAYIKVTFGQGSDNYVIGMRNDSSDTRWTIGRDSYHGWYYGYRTCCSSYNEYLPQRNTIADCRLNYLNSKKWQAQGSSDSVEASLPTLQFTPQYNIRLFGSAGVVDTFTVYSGKIYFVKISYGSNVIMDLIPVRVGQVGYMYDKISGQLFGNDGTGSFTLGPDKS